MFRKKDKPEWELESIYQTAVIRLQLMEEDPKSFMSTSDEEEELLTVIEFNTQRWQATPDDRKEEIARFKANIDLAKTRLNVVSKKSNTLSEQRAYVERLTKMRMEWFDSQRRRKLSPDAKMAAGVTVACASAPYIIERFGKLAQHLKTRVPLPRIWKN